MDEIGLDELMQLIIRDKGGTPKDYNRLMDYVAYHETGPKQRNNPKAKQISQKEDGTFYDGPGRGLFMFEKGEKKGGNTAVNRTVKYFKDNELSLPKWLRDLSMGSKESKSVDVSSLSADQQKMLFLGNHREHPKSNFSNIWTGKQTIDDFWLKNHWSGDADESAIKLDSFNKSMAHKDSTEALAAKKEELMYKQNMAPYLSDSNNINKLPSKDDILKGIFGEKDSSLIEKVSSEINPVVRDLTNPTILNTAERGFYETKNIIKEQLDDYRWRKDFRKWIADERKITEKHRRYFNKRNPDSKIEPYKRSNNPKTPITNPLIAAMLSPLAAGRGSTVIDPETGTNKYTGEQQYTPFSFGSEETKENYLSRLFSGYYNYAPPPGNTPHFSQDPEVQRSWWDKITDTRYNYKNMGKE